MESVGQKLRATRLQVGLSLAEISATTRISLRNLEAIENDDLSSLTSAFFYRSFVRQFAQQLHIDFKELAPAVQTITSGMPEPRMPGEDELASPRPKISPSRPSRAKRLRWLYSFTSLLVMLVGCSTVYARWQNSRPHFQATLAALVNLFPKHAAERSAPAVHTLQTPPKAATTPDGRLAVAPLIPSGE
jgi:cytoskeletal protein RodZ